MAAGAGFVPMGDPSRFRLQGYDLRKGAWQVECPSKN